jgi:hypothetical protein
MSEPEHDGCEHNDEVHVRGFAFPLPANLGALLAGQQQRQQLEVESAQQRIFNFLDSLNADDLFTLRRMLSCDANNHFDGMIITLLRVVHKVDPDSGLSEEEMLARIAGAAGPKSESAPPSSDEPEAG